MLKMFENSFSLKISKTKTTTKDTSFFPNKYTRHEQPLLIRKIAPPEEKSFLSPSNKRCEITRTHIVMLNKTYDFDLLISGMCINCLSISGRKITKVNAKTLKKRLALL